MTERLVAIGLLVLVALPIGAGTTSVDTTHTVPAERWRIAIADDEPERLVTMLDRADAPATLVPLSDTLGKTALMSAAKHGNERLVTRLLSAGADVRARTVTGGSPLMFASLGGHVEIMARLQRAGASLDAVGSNGWGAMMLAAAKGHEPAVAWLLENGADPNRTDVYGFTPLMRAVDNRHKGVVATLLTFTDLDLQAADEAGNTVLHHAVATGDVELVDLLLNAGARAVANHAGQPPF